MNVYEGKKVLERNVGSKNPVYDVYYQISYDNLAGLFIFIVVYLGSAFLHANESHKKKFSVVFLEFKLTTLQPLPQMTATDVLLKPENSVKCLSNKK